MPFSPENPTGFDMKTYKQATAPKSAWAQRDPWARWCVVLFYYLLHFLPRTQLAQIGVETNHMIYSEAWRYTGPFSRWNRFKRGFPGLGIATVAFAIYCGYEYAFLKKDEQH